MVDNTMIGTYSRFLASAVSNLLTAPKTDPRKTLGLPGMAQKLLSD